MERHNSDRKNQMDFAPSMMADASANRGEITNDFNILSKDKAGGISESY